MTSPPTISLPQARRTALAAQGFVDPRPPLAGATMRHLGRVLDRLRLLQIDSVNVLTRSHYLPVFSRLGSYDTTLLDGARDGTGPRGRASRRLVEYWAHEASLVQPQVWPLLAYRMAASRAEAKDHRVRTEHPGLLEAVADVVARHGPLTSREVEQHLPHGAGSDAQNWGWNWSAVKYCLELLFGTGEITSAGRTGSFERRYALTSQLLPAELLQERDRRLHEDPQEAVTELLRLALVAHGLGTRRCLADYFRVRGPRVEVGLRQLEERGHAERVRVRGWDREVWRDPGARNPRAVPGAALLSPFDSLIWQRERTQELWGMRYRLEIYVPAAKRVHGYYVLPFLLDEQLVGRVDLKSDRAAGVLRVPGLHWEPGTDVAAALPRLVAELETMAGWLGLGRVDLVGLRT